MPLYMLEKQTQVEKNKPVRNMKLRKKKDDKNLELVFFSFSVLLDSYFLKNLFSQTFGKYN